MKFKIRKNVWLYSYLFVLVVSILGFLLLGVQPKQNGVIVTGVNNSGCSVEEGDIITEIRGSLVRSSSDFYSIISNYKKGEYVSMVVNNKPGGCKLIEDGNVGISVKDFPSKKIKMSVDLGGGIVTVLKSDNPEKDFKVIKNRVLFFGYPSTKVELDGAFIKIIHPDYVSVDEILFRGKLEGKILEFLDVNDGYTEIRVNKKMYKIYVKNNSIEINNKTVLINQTFSIDDINFTLVNITQTNLILESVVFSNKNILSIIEDLSQLVYRPQFKVYEFRIPITFDEDASRNFIKIAKTMKIEMVEKILLLKGRIVYYLDGKPIGSASIPYSLLQTNISSINIIGFSDSEREVSETKNKIIASVKYGELSNIEKIEDVNIEPKFENAIHFFLLCVLATILLNSLYFIKKKITIYEFMIKSSTPFILFGIVLLSQFLMRFGIIIDVPLFLGILFLTFLSFSFSFFERKLLIFSVSMIVFSLFLSFLMRNFGIISLIGFMLVLLERNVLKKSF